MRLWVGGVEEETVEGLVGQGVEDLKESVWKGEGESGGYSGFWLEPHESRDDRGGRHSSREQSGCWGCQL